MVSWAALSTGAFQCLEERLWESLSTGRSIAHRQHFQLFDVVDQKLLEATGQHVLHFLVAAMINAERQDLALESLPPAVDASGFLPVMLNFDASV